MPVVVRARSIAATVLLIGILLPFASASIAVGSTPVAAGYRDFSFGSSAGTTHRATADKPQSKLWYTDGQWWAGMFNPEPTTKWKIYRLDAATQDWISTGVTVDDRDGSQGDWLWDEAHHKLYVASAHASADVRIFRYSYNAATDVYTGDDLDPSTANTFVDLPTGGSETVTIARDSNGQLWITYPHPDGVGGSDIKIATTASDDDPATFADEATWNSPVTLPTEGADRPTPDDISAIIAFGSGASAKVGVMYNIQTHDASERLYFTVHADSSADGSWAPKELVAIGSEAADDHINLKASSTGRLFAITKTGKDGNADLDLDLINLYERDPGSGAWTKHVVSSVREDQDRPMILVDDEQGAVFAFLGEHRDAGGKIYVKTASFADLAADSGSTPAFAPGLGADFIVSSSDLKIDDPTSTKQTVDHSSGIAVLASDRSTYWYLHNSATIAPSDAVPPSGRLTINAGAAITSSATVDLDVTAVDYGSPVSRIQLANDAGFSAPTEMAYRTHVSWTLPGGDGSKTVFVRWRDTDGNWSAAASDSIVLDTTAPAAGAVTIAGGAASIGGTATTLALSAPSDLTGITNVRISNSPTLSGGILASGLTLANTASTSWNLAWTGTQTVYAQWRDAAGHWSPLASDSVFVDITLPPPPGTVVINGGAVATRFTTVRLSISKPASDVTRMKVASSLSGLASAAWQTYASTKSWTLSGVDGLKAVYVQWRDSSGKVSAAAADTIRLDRVRPVGHAPVASLAVGNRVGATIPTLISWYGSDKGAGVRKYVLYRSINGGAFQPIALPTALSRSIVLGLSSARSYRFALRVIDLAGNVSVRAIGPILHPRMVQDTSTAIVYRGAWHGVSSPGYSGGHVRYATAAGARATYRVYGRGVALVSTIGPSRGYLRVYVNGVLRQTVNLQAPVTVTRRIVQRLVWSTVAWRTITFKVVGTSGHPRVDLDAIAVLR